jgi:uncharacterized protein (UPF0335 family)
MLINQPIKDIFTDIKETNDDDKTIKQFITIYFCQRRGGPNPLIRRI